MNISIDGTLNTDILIVGGGLAAVKSAYECSGSGLNITIAVKSRLCSGSSFSPHTSGLGCQCPLDDGDMDRFLEEINRAACGMNDEKLCRILVSEIRERTGELNGMGIDYKVQEVKRVACFARKPRYLFYWENWDKIRSNLYACFRSCSNINLMENTDILCLQKKDGCICGAVAVNGENKLIHIQAKAVILATGGFGDLFRHSFNVSDVSGDGHVMALDAGARLVNLEFIQLIPGFIKPVYKVILGEQTLKYCERVTDKNGAEVLEKYLPSDVGIRQCIDERAGHGPFTSGDVSRYFDIAMMKEILASGCEDGFRLQYGKKINEDRSDMMSIYVRWLKNRKRIDITEDEIYVIPFAHACNGGILIDEFCRTDVAGLFAVGEAAGGIHGANRLGGNSMGSCLVFGKRAADGAVAYCKNSPPAKNTDLADMNEAKALMEKKFNSSVIKSIAPGEAIEKIKNSMWRNANILRSEPALNAALNDISDLRSNYNAMSFFAEPRNIKPAVKAQHCMELAAVILQAMLIRKESRGPHFREDFPHMDEAGFRKRIHIGRTEHGEIEYQLKGTGS